MMGCGACPCANRSLGWFETGLYGPRSVRRRRFLLGQAATGAVSPQQFCSSQCSNSQFMTFLQQAISSRLLPANPIVGGAGTGSGGCPSNSSATGAAAAAKFTQIGASAAGTALTVVGALSKAGAIALPSAAIPIAGAAIAAVSLILGQIFANHAKAEQLQSSVLCENVPAANAALQGIDQLTATGALSASDTLTAYAQLAQQFNSAMRSDPSYKTGDALWGYNQALQAVIAQRTLDLQASGATTGVAASLGVPPLLLWGGGVAALWFLL